MNYKDGKKYCRRCEIYLFHVQKFCPCCGMALRKSPTGRKQKE
jgi:ribosomal protein L37E